MNKLTKRQELTKPPYREKPPWAQMWAQMSVGSLVRGLHGFAIVSHHNRMRN